MGFIAKKKELKNLTKEQALNKKKREFFMVKKIRRTHCNRNIERCYLLFEHLKQATILIESHFSLKQYRTNQII